MNIKVHYEEVANYVEKHYMIRPQLKRIDDKTLEVSCQMGLFIPPMVLQIHIEAMRKDVVCLSYECGTGMAMLIAGAVEHLDNKLPHGIEIKPEDKRFGKLWNMHNLTAYKSMKTAWRYWLVCYKS